MRCAAALTEVNIGALVNEVVIARFEIGNEVVTGGSCPTLAGVGALVVAKCSNNDADTDFHVYVNAGYLPDGSESKRFVGLRLAMRYAMGIVGRVGGR